MTASDDPIEVTETRRSARHVGPAPLRATFGPLAVMIQNLSEGGFQISHEESLKIGSSAGLIFENPATSEALAFRCRVVWSRLSSTAAANFKPSYRSGVRIESFGDGSRDALQRLIRQLGPAEEGSLDRKRVKALEVARRRAAAPVVKTSGATAIAAEVHSGVAHAWGKLKANPAEAARLYRVARASLSLKELQTLQGIPREQMEPVLAVWHALDRRIPLSVVARVMEKIGEGSG